MNSRDTVVPTSTFEPSENNVLVLSPHTDDGELGAGGTIARFLDEGRNVNYIAFSGCETSVPEGMPKDTLEKSASALQLLWVYNPEKRPS